MSDRAKLLNEIAVLRAENIRQDQLIKALLQWGLNYIDWSQHEYEDEPDGDGPPMPTVPSEYWKHVRIP